MVIFSRSTKLKKFSMLKKNKAFKPPKKIDIFTLHPVIDGTCSYGYVKNCKKGNLQVEHTP